ncbi:hypothetical protein BIY40_09275 [Pediococcus acidilactici]|nr:hypothetical protein BIY40_09275 [Pediococcus acidilactici]
MTGWYQYVKPYPTRVNLDIKAFYAGKSFGIVHDLAKLARYYGFCPLNQKKRFKTFTINFSLKDNKIHPKSKLN